MLFFNIQIILYYILYYYPTMYRYPCMYRQLYTTEAHDQSSEKVHAFCLSKRDETNAREMISCVLFANHCIVVGKFHSSKL